MSTYDETKIYETCRHVPDVELRFQPKATNRAWEAMVYEMGRELMPILLGGKKWEIQVEKIERAWYRFGIEIPEHYEGKVLTIRARIKPLRETS